MASTNIQKTYADGGNHQIGTFSFWLKRTRQGADTEILYRMTSGSHYFQFIFEDTDAFIVREYLGSNNIYIKTNRLFRDTSAWYHIVVRFDTTQSTEADRVRIYVNGVQETSFDSATYPSQNANLYLGEQQTFNIGSTGSANYFDGLMSHFHYCDGYSYAPTEFGETDSTTGEWKINTSPSVSYGTVGFWILKDGNTVTDSSPNSNDHTVSNGTLGSTKDCPSNVYTTWNYLNRSLSSGIQSSGYLNGGTFIATETANNHRSFGSTLAFPGTGKFYAEFKIGNLGGAAVIGIMESEEANTLLGKTDTSSFSDNAKGWGYKNNGYKENGGSSSTYGASFVNYSYLMLAYNNGALWFGKDGTWANSATATEIANATTGNAAYSGLDTTKNYYLMFRGYNDSMIELNAGNGWFRTTEVSSPNNPSSGDTGAKFKYAVPTGLQPVSTKGFNA